MAQGHNMKVIMSLYDESSFYEIIELENGDIALRQAERSEGDALVEIRFSEESQFFLGKAKFDVAKTMIEAGLDLVAELSEQESATETGIEAPASPVIH